MGTDKIGAAVAVIGKSRAEITGSKTIAVRMLYNRCTHDFFAALCHPFYQSSKIIFNLQKERLPF